MAEISNTPWARKVSFQAREDPDEALIKVVTHRHGAAPYLAITYDGVTRSVVLTDDEVVTLVEALLTLPKE